MAAYISLLRAISPAAVFQHRGKARVDAACSAENRLVCALMEPTSSIIMNASYHGTVVHLSCVNVDHVQEPLPVARIRLL